ncbi:MAG: polysaccharide biosynthesis/export family protein [Flavobacteriaceae bacterium]
MIPANARAMPVLLAALLLAGCASLPRSGPDSLAISADASASQRGEDADIRLQYALVDINAKVVAFVGEEEPGSIYQTFGGGRGAAPAIRVGVGDVVQVTVFEADQGGLFIPVEAGSRPGNFVTLPQQTVDQSGEITVPYAGKVKAAGRSTAAIQSDIEARLKDRAIEPQVVVAVLDRQATSASVVGDVNAPNTFPVNPSGDRVLDMIARAGGPKQPGYETYVTLQRKGSKSTVFFETLVSNPKENIYVAPGDAIYVFRDPRTFIAFGAAGLNGRYDFGDDKLSLAEGVGKAGGVIDGQADPSQVYLYRMEDRHALEGMGVDLSGFPAEQKIIPTIYRSNFRIPENFLVAQNFPMRDKDVIYISNARSVEILKFLTLVDAIAGTVGYVGDAKTQVRRAF